MKFIIDEVEEPIEIELSKSDIGFIFAYERFGFEFYGTNEKVLILLKKLFEAGEETFGSDGKTFSGYIFNYEDVGNKINNMEFAIFVLWYMNDKQLLEYGTSPRNSWCHYQKFGYSERARNTDYFGFLIAYYFRNNTVDHIYDMLEVDVLDLKRAIKREQNENI